MVGLAGFLSSWVAPPALGALATSCATSSTKSFSSTPAGFVASHASTATTHSAQVPSSVVWSPSFCMNFARASLPNAFPRTVNSSPALSLRNVSSIGTTTTFERFFAHSAMRALRCASTSRVGIDSGASIIRLTVTPLKSGRSPRSSGDLTASSALRPSSMRSRRAFSSPGPKPSQKR